MAPTPTATDDHRARRRLARVPAAARLATAVVLTGIAAVGCGTISAVSLQPVAGNVSVVASGTASAGGSAKASTTRKGKPSPSPSPTASRSHKPSGSATKKPSPSASATGDPAPSGSSAPTQTPSQAPPPTDPPPADCQQSFVPSYFYDGGLWDQAIDTSPTPSVMFLNVDNGPGTGPVSHFQGLVQTAQQHGITVLGYVSTVYATVPIAQVEAQIADYKAWYGVNGIMLDLTQGEQSALSYYQTLYDYIHSEISGAIIWLNVGAFPDSSFMSVANVIMVFEGSYASFEGDSVPGWVDQYPRNRFAQVIYDTPEADLSTAASVAWSRQAGYLFVTDLGDPNPYAALPSYWSTEAGTVAATC